MVGQPEVVVGADHDLPLTTDACFGRRGFLDGREVRIDAHRLDFVGIGVVTAFIEKTHRGLLARVRTQVRNRAVVDPPATVLLGADAT